MTEMTMIEALNLAMREEMEADDSVILLGEDIGVDGGIFRVTEGLLDRFGEARVMDTPLAESGIVGAAIGMALYGLRPVCEMQFSGFSYFAFHQIESHAARFRYRSQGRFHVPMVVRMPYGAGVRALEHHSESREAFYAHIAGLKTVIPSGPRNARALLRSAIRDPDPVIFYEPKAAYRSFREEVPDEPDSIEIGVSERVREGEDLTVITWGAMLRRTLEAVDLLSREDGIACDVIDLLTVSPMDDALFTESVKKTGRAIVIHEAPRSFGPGGEITARIEEKAFEFLEAPVGRVAGFDVVVPFFFREEAYLPDAYRIAEAARSTLSY
ncbi:MAG: alpha-ketoacid dehydrogenase subunit beta [Alphaproteobacteria bacterium]